MLKKVLTNAFLFDILTKLSRERDQEYGGIAQLARAIGSYPIGRGFKSNFRYQPQFTKAVTARWSRG